MLKTFSRLSSCQKRWYKTWNSECDNISLVKLYENLKQKKSEESKKDYEAENVESVFVCNNIDLAKIEVYGFSYNQVLVSYTSDFNKMIFDTAKNILVERYRYPTEVLDLKYDPEFSIVGLHFDTRFGTILKLDSFVHVQPMCVYRGKKELPIETVEKLYTRMMIPSGMIDTGYSGKNKAVKNLSNYYSNSEIDLICSLVSLFDEKKIRFIPETMYYDVQRSVILGKSIYTEMIEKYTEKYIKKSPDVRTFLERLKEHKKKMFIIANNSYITLDNSLSFLVGKDWREFFDVVITRANKPTFFRNMNITFRQYDVDKKLFMWERAKKFKKNAIYFGGNVQDFMAITGWKPHKIIYFGNNPYKDLAVVTTSYGWHTCAIVNELEFELKTLNTDEYRKNDSKSRFITQFIEEYQDRVQSEEDQCFLAGLYRERYNLLRRNKIVFNKQFGSVFRTYNNSTLYGRRLLRSCDVYTSKLVNLLDYGFNHKFFAKNVVMPHETII